jgi:hypothetical protein
LLVALSFVKAATIPETKERDPKNAVNQSNIY